MAEIELTSNTLILKITGWDRILALKSQVEVPLNHVVSVEIDSDKANQVFSGLKLPGTHVPGLVTTGSFWKQGEWTFFDVHDIKKAITIHLSDEHY